MTQLAGAFPVLCTPFDARGRIAEADFAAVIDFVLGCGAQGCVFPGVASEVETLAPEERRHLVTALGARLAGRIPFIVGASDPEPGAVIARINEGAAAGARAAMVIAPGCLGGDVAAQRDYFARIGEATPLPLMLQNQPVPIGAGLAATAIAEIARGVPAIRYVKEEILPCGQNLTLIRAALGHGIAGVFGGAGGRYVTDELARGALGTMPACELADLHAALIAAWGAGDILRARDLFRLSLPLLNFQAVFRMRMTKHVLHRRGVIRHLGVRAAGPVPDRQDIAELDALFDQIAPHLDGLGVQAVRTEGVA